MAKENSKLRLIHLILVLLGIFATAIGGWVWQQAETKALGKETMTLGKETMTLSEEGCGPAKKHESQIVLMEYRLDSIDKGMENFNIEQKAWRKESKDSFKEILERLPK